MPRLRGLYLNDHFFRQNRLSIVFAQWGDTGMTALGNHILRVVFVSSDAQVSRVYALRRIATVHYKHAIRYWAVNQFATEPVRPDMW
jgi:hypothetical protein